MFRLYCDICNREILPFSETPLVKLEVEEMFYNGENGDGREFMSNYECKKGKFHLCPDCNNRLKQFMNLKFFDLKGE